jgi:hypothetical protein
MMVGLLTSEQKDSLVGQLYAPDSYFNPIQDANGNWIISLEEVDQCTEPDFLWVKQLPLIDFVPIEDIE